jgi:hypothetical protein
LPGNLNPANPIDMLPIGLAGAFTEQVSYESFDNRYPDGSSDRAVLVINPRRFFKLTRKLTAAQYTALFTFYKAHLVAAFFFYNGCETVPPFTSDPTGASTTGRYTVVFDGSWSDAVTLGRSQASFGLREVA